MPQVSVTIAGRVYRMACGEGEEDHLRGLARRLDGKIGALRGDFGEIGDQRITMMAAITMADELSEAEKRIAALEQDIADLTERGRAQDSRLDAVAGAVSTVLDGITADIDQAVATLLAGDAGRAVPSDDGGRPPKATLPFL